MKRLGEEKSDFNITLLICSMAFPLVQTDEDFTVNGHKDTHKHTIHKHTHTHTHTHTQGKLKSPFLET